VCVNYINYRMHGATIKILNTMFKNTCAQCVQKFLCVCVFVGVLFDIRSFFFFPCQKLNPGWNSSQLRMRAVTSEVLQNIFVCSLIIYWILLSYYTCTATRNVAKCETLCYIFHDLELLPIPQSLDIYFSFSGNFVTI